MSDKKFEVPQITSVKNLPPEIQQMFFDLIAYTVNCGQIATVINAKGVNHEGLQLGDWELRVSRVD